MAGKNDIPSRVLDEKYSRGGIPVKEGKTLLAKAVAGEAKVPFFRISGAEFFEMDGFDSRTGVIILAATNRHEILDYGMSEKFTNVVLPSQRSPMFLPGEAFPGQREYSESTQQYIDEEITRIIKGRYDKVKGLLEEKKGAVDRIAKRLLEVETLGEEEFKALLNAPSALR